ncbi:MAG: hypothetical protein ACFB21_15005 [Opitutales bacterium]
MNDSTQPNARGTRFLLPAIGLLAVASTPAFGALTSYSTGFENLSTLAPGSRANGAPLVQPSSEGWRGDGLTGLGGQNSYDAEIVSVAGNNVLRMANSLGSTTGNYDVTHPSTPALMKVGESSVGATPGSFSFSFDFQAAIDTVQSGLQIDVTPFESGTASRQSLIRILDDQTDGLSLGVFDTNAAGAFSFTPLATNLDRTAWHTVTGELFLNNGVDNDQMSISINGGPEFLLGSWEGYYRSFTSQDTAPVDSLIFRMSTESSGVARGNGVYFDNVSTVVSPIPEPSVYLAGLTAVGVLGSVCWKRRKTQG